MTVAPVEVLSQPPGELSAWLSPSFWESAFHSQPRLPRLSAGPFVREAAHRSVPVHRLSPTAAFFWVHEYPPLPREIQERRFAEANKEVVTRLAVLTASPLPLGSSLTETVTAPQCARSLNKPVSQRVLWGWREDRHGDGPLTVNRAQTWGWEVLDSPSGSDAP